MAYNTEAPVLDTYQAVVSAYGDFLTVAIHTILYERNIYPENSWIKARKYNFPVRQNRHPKVCQWIHDAVAAVEAEMLKCTVALTSLIIHAPPPTSLPLERYVFNTSAFPKIPASETLTPFAAVPSDPEDPPQPHPKDKKRYHPPPTSNLPEQFRATLTRLIPSMSRLDPLPPDCSFTLAIELRDEDEAEAPLRRGEGDDGGGRWIAVEPTLQKPMSGKEEEEVLGGEDGRQRTFAGRKEWGRDRGGMRTVPVRSLEAGAFAMEVWVEEGRAKFGDMVGDEEDVTAVGVGMEGVQRA